jgi:hypothetical protein
MRELDGLACEVGGYRLVARRTDSWEAIVEILLELDAEHPDYFHQVMRGCRELSNSGRELDGLDGLLADEEQILFDLAVDREQRRHEQGYVAPAQARAFLQKSRQLQLASSKSQNYAGDRKRPLPHIRTRMKFVLDSDAAAYATRNEELTYIANTIMSGCALHGRPFTGREALDAAVAACNLGLENWPRLQPPAKTISDDFLITQDLVSVFQVGWTVLHKDVGMYAAGQLVKVLAGFRCNDRETQAGLDALRVELSACCLSGTPWRAREALDVIAILDTPAWSALLCLLDEYPALPAAVNAWHNPRTRSVSATAFEFISENRQIDSIRQFIQSLPEILATE